MEITTDKNDKAENGEKITGLFEAAGVVYLDFGNCRFVKHGDFLGAEISVGEAKSYGRVWLHRSFPYELPENYISVQDADGEEIGLIRSLDSYDEEQKALIGAELARKYYTPKIERILSLKETHGTSFWKCLTDAGELSFTLQDTSRSISKVGGDAAVITDMFGNRYRIASLKGLDKKSMRKLEIYL